MPVALPTTDSAPQRGNDGSRPRSLLHDGFLIYLQQAGFGINRPDTQAPVQLAIDAKDLAIECIPLMFNAPVLGVSATRFPGIA